MKEVEELEYAWMFRAHFAGVQRTVFLVIHDRARSEDITQDAFLQLLQKWRTVAQYERPEAWVRRVAIRLAVRDVRRERLRNVLEPARRQEASDDQLPDIDVARAMQQLPPMQRAAVALYYFDDLPVGDISHVLQVSESTVKQHLMRARRRLAGLLHEEVSEDVR